MKRSTPLALSLALVASAALANDEIQAIEGFALAEDRTQALEQLIPGTEDYYYYHCVHHQTRGEFAKVEDLLRLWIKRYGHTGRVIEIQNRQALLTYEQNPQRTLEHVRRRLGLSFNHRKEELGPRADLPSRLDPRLISRQTLTQRALSRSRNTSGFTDASLEWLAATNLNPDRRRHLLSRLKRPDLPNLVRLVVDDLNHRYSRGFGSHKIHGEMLLPQLEELLQHKPDLLNNGNYVNTVVRKLRPSDDVAWQDDPQEKKAYLDRLWGFVSRLAPVHNSLKAHVLYHRLAFDREQGQLDRERFDTYVRIPRSVNYANRDYLNRREHRRFRANLRANYHSHTQLPSIGNDEPLVRAYLMELFKEARSPRNYEQYIDDTYLKHVFAETKILAGTGDMEQWYSMLPPAKYKALKERVDLEFAPTTRLHYTRDEDVRLELDVKNVKTLIVKVYQLNTKSYYRSNGREVNTDISLDGLVANVERTLEYGEPALRRVRRSFDFPELKQAGTYVVDFIGNGRSSRALVRKGSLRVLERTSVAGHVLTVVDERDEPQPGATVWMGGNEYVADEQGTVTLPFSNSPGARKAVLSMGAVSSLAPIQQQRERYQLSAGFYVDREALIQRKKAQVAVRVALAVNGNPVTLQALESTTLHISSTDMDGVSSTKTISNFEVFEDRESLVEFNVPERLARLGFSITARVKNLSQGKTETLTRAESFALNAIDATDRIEAVHLLKLNGSYALEVLGKTGEVLANRPVSVSLRHRDFREQVNVSLQTDAAGRIALGPLPGITWLQANSPGAQLQSSLSPDRRTYPASVHGKAGETLFVPTMSDKLVIDPAEVSLLEVRGGTFVRDRLSTVSVRPGTGLLAIDGLEPGDYDLMLKDSGASMRLRVDGGVRAAARQLVRKRELEVRSAKPLQIAGVSVGAKRVQVRLQHSTPQARVHVIATRYVPAYSAFDHLGSVRDRDPFISQLRRVKSVTVSGRDIGDEYRYILERQYATKFPGNMLKRPSVLLNPWAIRDTESGTQTALDGEAFGGGATGGGGSRYGRGGLQGRSGSAQDFANLDFLGQPSAALYNLDPDKNGVVSVALSELGPHQHLHVIAVDPQSTVLRTVSLPEQRMTFDDVRLLKGLDPKSHVTEQKQTTVVRKGGSFVVEDLTTSSFETYDSLAKVYRLFTTISGDKKLAEFEFVLRWPELKDAEKRAKYSKYACHELSFFVAEKDPEFFREVVQPYLKNKKDKTFLDHYLVGAKLDAYLEPWRYERLNVVERILLGRRLRGERAAAARHVQDRYDVLPPRGEQLERLFATALKTSSLDTEDSLGVGKLRSELMKKEMESLREEDRRMGRRPRRDAGEGAGLAFSDDADEEAEMDGAPADMPAEAPMAEAAPMPAKPQAPGGRARRARSKVGKKAKNRWNAKDMARRESVRQLYRKLDKTKEWVENNYHHLPIEVQNGQLITVNGFWRDFAATKDDGAFVSPRFTEASRNFPEMMFALSVLDLPFKAGKHEATFQGAKMSMTAAGPAVMVHKGLATARAKAQATPILVSQNFYRHGDRYRRVNGERVDKFVTEEFLIHTVYGCQVVVTNPTSSRQKLDVLVQIPRGAVPVARSHATRSVRVNLGPYSTYSLDYKFYFPKAGKRQQFPVHVAKNEQLVANAEAFTFNVVESLTKVDKTSWAWISQHGSQGDVMRYLQQQNLEEIALSKIAWRMQDRAFFSRVTELLSTRHVYDGTLWSYGIKHAVVPAINTYLQHADGFVRQCGMHLVSPLLTIDPVLRHSYQHMDYDPLVNARAHQLGKRRKILNGRFHAQYHRLLKLLSYKGSLSDADLLDVTYYMFLQDRVEEALAAFARVNPDELATRLQYDYFAAFAAFYRADLKTAETIAKRYADHPVERWRAKFANVGNQLAEITGGASAVSDEQDRQQAQDRLASQQPSFELVVESKQVTLEHQNVKEATVNYYLMDLELLFSRNPFVQQVSGRFSFIKPNATHTVSLEDPSGKTQFELPAKFHTSNVLVEVVAGGETRAVPYYSNSLKAQVVENYGQLRVTAGKRPLPGAYVKVYAKIGGQAKFYKDGYTDLRGRFDYTSLNTNELDHVSEFSLLVVSEKNGAVVKRAKPPQR